MSTILGCNAKKEVQPLSVPAGLNWSITFETEPGWHLNAAAPNQIWIDQLPKQSLNLSDQSFSQPPLSVGRHQLEGRLYVCADSDSRAASCELRKLLQPLNVEKLTSNSPILDPLVVQVPNKQR